MWCVMLCDQSHANKQVWAYSPWGIHSTPAPCTSHTAVCVYLLKGWKMTSESSCRQSRRAGTDKQHLCTAQCWNECVVVCSVAVPRSHVSGHDLSGRTLMRWLRSIVTVVVPFVTDRLGKLAKVHALKHVFRQSVLCPCILAVINGSLVTAALSVCGVIGAVWKHCRTVVPARNRHIWTTIEANYI